jgi:hypothetical protein
MAIKSPVEDIDNMWQRLQSGGYLQAAQAQQALECGNYLQQSAISQPANLAEPNVHVKALRLLKARLVGLNNSYRIDNDEIILTHVYQDKVFIFFVLRGRAGYLEDELALFPSDGLVTKLRMIS